METNILKMITIADIASLANALCGLIAIFFILNGENIISAEFLLLAVFFDCIDGSIARTLNTHSHGIFGEMIDSLSDIVSFGVAPAVIIYMISPTYYMIIPSLVLLTCGLLRLARYNTLLEYQDKPTKTFLGLPIPISSTLLAALILSGLTNVYLVAILILIISILMVTEIKYPKPHDKKIVAISAILVILCIIPALNTILLQIPSYLLLIGVLIYVFGVLVLNARGDGISIPKHNKKEKTLYKN